MIKQLSFCGVRVCLDLSDARMFDRDTSLVSVLYKRFISGIGSNVQTSKS